MTRVTTEEGKVEANGSVTITAAYIYDTAGKLVACQIPGQSSLQYYVTNGHGDIMEIQDATGKVLNRYTYDIWGNTLIQEEQVPNIFRYSGEYWAAATDLQYLRARWYNPSIGRFLTEDTYEGEINNPLSLNLYTYVYNNPLISLIRREILYIQSLRLRRARRIWLTAKRILKPKQMQERQ